MEKRIVTAVVRRRLDEQAPVFRQERAGAWTTIDDRVIGRWTLRISAAADCTVEVQANPLEYPQFVSQVTASADGDAQDNVREALVEAITRGIERGADPNDAMNRASASNWDAWNYWRDMRERTQRAISAAAREMAEETVESFCRGWRGG